MAVAFLIWGTSSKNAPFKIFDVVIPKKGLVDWGLPILFFSLTPTLELYMVFFTHSITDNVNRCYSKRMICKALPANPLLVWKRQRSLGMFYRQMTHVIIINLTLWEWASVLPSKAKQKLKGWSTPNTQPVETTTDYIHNHIERPWRLHSMMFF